MPGTTAHPVDPAPNPHRALYEAQVHRQLQQWGLSPPGLQQLEQGRMPSDAQDRRLVTASVAQAARDGAPGPAPLPRQTAREALARAWVLWRLGLCSEAGRVAAQLAHAVELAQGDTEAEALLAGVVDILRAAGRHGLAGDLMIQAGLPQPGSGPGPGVPASAAQQA